MQYIGIDPGKSGAMVMIDMAGELIDHFDFKDATDHDIAETLAEWKSSSDLTAILEKVHSMPGQGVASSFKFGASYGGLKMALACLKIPYQLVSPSKWQGDLGCRTGGNKNITKEKAQQLYPNYKITHACADAILLAVYARGVRV